MRLAIDPTNLTRRGMEGLESKDEEAHFLVKWQ